jgi:hypothetical protein
MTLYHVTVLRGHRRRYTFTDLRLAARFAARTGGWFETVRT